MKIRAASATLTMLFFMVTVYSQTTITTNTTYNAGNKPAANTAIVINGATLTIDDNVTLASITFTAGATGSLVVNNGFTLTITNAITVNSLAAVNTSASISGAGSITAASVAVGDAPLTNSNNTYTHTLTCSVNSLIVSGNLSVISSNGGTGRNHQGTYSHTSGSLLQIGGNLTTSNTVAANTSTVSISSNVQRLNLGGTAPVSLSATGTNNITISAQTVNYNGASQTVYPNTTYSNLELTGSGTKTLSASTTSITGNLITGGTASATAAVGLTIGGSLTVGSGSTFNASTFTHNVAGNFSNSGTFNASTGTINLNGTSAQSVGGSSTTTFNNLNINNTNASGVSAGNNFNVNGTLSIPAGRRLNMQTFNLGGSTLVTSGTGLLRTQSTSSTPLPAGRTWSFWVDYDYSNAGTVASQTAVGGTFSRLRMSSLHGAKASGNITVNDTIDLAVTHPATHATNNPEYAHGSLEMVKQYTAHTGADALEYGNYAGVYTSYSKEFSFNSTTMSFFKFCDTYEIGVNDSLLITQISSDNLISLKNRITDVVSTVSLDSFNLAIVGGGSTAKKYNRSGFPVSIVDNASNVTNTPGGIHDRLDSWYLNMGASAVTTGIGSVTGKIRRTSIAANTEYSFGNPNTTLTFSLNGGAGADLPTQVVMFVSKGPVRGVHPNRTNTVRRLYQIVRTGGNPPVTFNVKLHYRDDELNDVDPNKMELWDHHIPYSSDNTPHQHGHTARDLTNKWVRLSGMGIAYMNTNESAIGNIDNNPATPNRKKYWMIFETRSVFNEWLGATPNAGQFNFTDNFNWTKGVVPGENDDVRIPANAANPPTTIGSDITVKTFEVEQGAQFTVPEGRTITIKGGIRTNGGKPSLSGLGNISFGAGSKVVFDYPRTSGTVDVDGIQVPINETAYIEGDVDLNDIEVKANTYLRSATNSSTTIRGAVTQGSGSNIDFDSYPNTVVYRGNSAQSIIKPQGNSGGYYNLKLLGNATKTFPAAILAIKGNLVDSTSNNSASTLAFNAGYQIRFSGSATQQLNSVHPLNIPRLRISNSTAAIQVGNQLTVSDSLVIDSGSEMHMGDKALLGATLKTAGTGKLVTQNLTQALPAGRSWTFDVDYAATADSQKVVSWATYQKLLLTGSGRKFLTGNEEMIVENALEIANPQTYLEIAAGQKVNARAATINNAGGNQGIRILAQANQPNASFLFGNAVNEPVAARVQLYSKANLDGTTYNWQYLGVPVTGYTRFNLPSGSFIAGYDEPTRSYKGPSALVPFTGYAMTHNVVGRSFEFDGNLINSTQVIPLNYTVATGDAGYNMVANSFTTAVRIDQLAFENAESTVWLFNTGSNTDATEKVGAGQYLTVPLSLAGTEDFPSEISSLQGFFVRATAANATVTIPYSATALTSNTQPMRAPSVDVEKVYSRIEVQGSKLSDRVWIFTQEGAGNSFDNGWDGRKLDGVASAPLLYAVGNDGRYQVHTTDNMHNTMLAFRKGSDTNYQLRFNHRGIADKYSKVMLTDMLTAETIDVSADSAVYEFTETRPEESLRFKITTIQGQITGNSIAAEKQLLKLIYQNQYLIAENNTDEQGEIRIYDVHGRLMQDLSMPARESRKFDVRLAAGIYLVKASAKSESVVLRIFSR